MAYNARCKGYYINTFTATLFPVSLVADRGHANKKKSIFMEGVEMFKYAICEKADFLGDSTDGFENFWLYFRFRGHCFMWCPDGVLRKSDINF